MKVLIAVILAIGSASALGSGPYLPSGWRPQGPAFYLPSEVQKPADNPIKETLLLETEAAGSEGLREYGPPAEELNAIQALPDVVTDQAFYVIQSQAEQVAEVNQDLKSEVQEAITGSVDSRIQTDIDVTTAAYDFTEANTEVATEAEITYKAEEITSKAEEIVELVTDKAELVEVKEIEATVEALEERLGSVVVKEEEKLEKVVVETLEVKNIEQALVNLENEIKSEQVRVEAAELKTTQEGSGSVQVPEGFLEYGPPGFREYGPPKSDELLRSAVIAQDISSFDNNETRRRRFSPKFKSPKNKRH